MNQALNKGLSLILRVTFLLASFMACIPFRVVAQNAPVTTAATVNNAVSGQQVTVPVKVTGFNNIGSITLSLDYDTAELQFVSAAKNPNLVGSFNVGDNDLGNGLHRLVLGWFGPGLTLPDSSTVVDYVFVFHSGPAGLEWFDMGPSCEYTDDNANILNDVPTSGFYINGLVCGVLPTPGTISGISDLCQGMTSVNYSVTPMANVLGYSWTVPQGAVIASGAGTNSVLVDFAPDASSGNISVSGINECGNGLASVLPVNVNLLPVADAGEDITIGYSTSAFLHASPGGTGIYIYHWSPENLLLNPYLQNPQTVQLTSSTVFQLTVTNDVTQCFAGDEMTVHISGGPLGVNPMSVPSVICRGLDAQLFANAGGGSGTYTYAWSSIPAGNPPWSSTLANPLVSPDSSTQYHVAISDGFNTTSGFTTLQVQQLPTAHMSGGGEICDDGSTVSLQIDLTGVPPWAVMYTEGLNTTAVSGIQETPFLVNTSVAGNYVVTNVTDEYCQGYASGTAGVSVFAVPVRPEISLSGYLLSSDAALGNQWYRNDTAINGADGQFFLAPAGGFYSDIVSLNGCSSDTSNVIEVVIEGLSGSKLSEANVFPNPFSDHCYLSLPAPSAREIELIIFNCNGTIVRHIELTNKTSQERVKLDFGKLPPGIYILQLNTQKESRRIKLVSQ